MSKLGELAMGWHKLNNQLLATKRQNAFDSTDITSITPDSSLDRCYTDVDFNFELFGFLLSIYDSNESIGFVYGKFSN
jgi:hypothetical protein